MSRSAIRKWGWSSRTATRETRKFFDEKFSGPGDAKVTSRLTADLWVSAYLARLGQANIPAYVTARGDATAGAVLVKLALLDGTARAYERTMDLTTGGRRWMVLGEGAEAEIDAMLARQRSRDPDLWVIEIEDRQGRTLLDQDGLSQ
jgi:hypothetical protein